MRKFFSCLIIFAMMSFCLSAQRQEVTTFLNIPVDGSIAHFKREILSKGFAWSPRMKCYSGEFNGVDVGLSIVTQKNKVWRVTLLDAEFQDEAQVKIRFNKLCSQFERNKRYIQNPFFEIGQQMIPEGEDISHEMDVNDKVYEACLYQIPDNMDVEKETEEIYEAARKGFSDEELENPSEEVKNKYLHSVLDGWAEVFGKRVVWFKIVRIGREYGIAMFYDNPFNQADGSDL